MFKIARILELQLKLKFEGSSFIVEPSVGMNAYLVFYKKPDVNWKEFPVGSFVVERAVGVGKNALAHPCLSALNTIFRLVISG